MKKQQKKIFGIWKLENFLEKLEKLKQLKIYS